MAHWSLLVVFSLIAISLARGAFPHWHPTWTPGLCWGVAIAAAALFFLSIALHELAHALVGRAQGIRIDGISLFMFGGIAHMRSDATSPRAEFLMAIVGPLMSFAIGMTSLVVGSALAYRQLPMHALDPFTVLAQVGPIPTLLLWLGPVNVLLAVFNMIPGFPLDGGRVLRAMFWWATGDLRKATHWASIAGQTVAWLLITCGVLMAFDVRVPLFGVGLANGLWLVLIGWFLNNAARLSYQQVLMREAFEGVLVRSLMRSELVTVSPDTPIDVLVGEHVMASDQRAFPVVRDGDLIGLISLSDVRRVPRAQWSSTLVLEAMTPSQELHVLRPEDRAMDAFQQLGRYAVNSMPVVDHGHLSGIVRREDLLKWLMLQHEVDVTP